MKTKKTLKAVAMICAGIILLQGYAAAADQNDQVARVDTGARYTTDGQNTGQANTKVADKRADTMTMGAVILAEVVAPWGTVPGLLTVYSGVGMIVNAVDALIPDKNNKPENNRVEERVAHNNPETKAVANLAANDRN